MSDMSIPEPEPYIECGRLTNCDDCIRALQSIADEERRCHTPHCAKRIVWGDGLCECGACPGNCAECDGGPACGLPRNRMETSNEAYRRQRQ